MIEMRVRDKDVIDRAHLGQTQITDAGTSIYQHVVIEQQRGGAQVAPDSAAASQYSQFHLKKYPFASLPHSFRLEDEHTVPVLTGWIIAIMDHALGVHRIQF